MLYTACQFLSSERQRVIEAIGRFPFHESQVSLSSDYIPDGMIRPFERRGYDLADKIHNLYHNSEACLRKISLELAAFRPLAGEGEDWPADFLKSLERHLLKKKDDPEGLKYLVDVLKAGSNVREMKKSFILLPWEKNSS